MRGIRQMSPGKDIPLWLVFATQCFLDAQHELKSNISNGHDQLRHNANNIRASIDQNLKFHKTLRIVNWPKENDKAFTEMLYCIHEWVGKDVVAGKWQKVKSLGRFPLEDRRLTPKITGAAPCRCSCQRGLPTPQAIPCDLRSFFLCPQNALPGDSGRFYQRLGFNHVYRPAIQRGASRKNLARLQDMEGHGTCNLPTRI